MAAYFAMIFRLRGRQELRRSMSAVVACCAALVLAAKFAGVARAGYTADSPEVKAIVNKGLAYLEKHADDRFGGKCLIGLAFLKAGKPDHPRVREAVDECRNQMKANENDRTLDVYSNGLAVIFLCEASPRTFAREIEFFLGRLKARQKEHGGWGYADNATGDTSQTQYAALAYWEANRHGFNIDGPSVEKLSDWLIRTQAPDGSWGYQGQVSPTSQPIPQDEATCSLLSAAMGSMYICADLFGLRPGGYYEDPTGNPLQPIPAALRRVEASAALGEPKRIRITQANPAAMFRAIKNGHAWMEKNYKIASEPKEPKTYYYLYGLERYKSFQEALEGNEEISPGWYNDGVEFLAADQTPDGSFKEGYCGPECDTAFSILFLLRSTKKSIRAKLGEGVLLAGRGLPSNLKRTKMRNGQLIVEQVHTKVDELLSMVDNGNEGTLDELARDPSQLVVDNVDEKSARRLQQLVRGGSPEARLLAVRALGRAGNLDYVPTMLYALTDPDVRVVLEARNSLRFISRNFDGFGPPDDFTEQQRYEAVDAWKRWYKAIRPTAVLEK
jgi:hypothetical protein